MNTLRPLALALFVCATLPFSAGAATSLSDQNTTNSALEAFRYYTKVTPSVVVPTVVEVPLAIQNIDNATFAVLDLKTKTLLPYFVVQEVRKYESPISVEPNTARMQSLVDKNMQTFTSFEVAGNTPGVAHIVLTSTDQITSSALSISISDNVTPPTQIEIRANINNRETIVVANRSLNALTVPFPRTTSNRWTITFTYQQPLRISELRLVQEGVAQSQSRSIRFLSQPDRSYEIYAAADRMVNVPLPESGNLAINTGVLKLSPPSILSNPSYVISDIDKDTIPDIRDNCISIENTDQVDLNGNGRGDVCDDFDTDSIINSIDNCPDLPNANQADTDSDGIGDVCDSAESRLTEQYPWLPWTGIGFAIFVLIALTILTIGTQKKDISPTI